MWHDIFGHIGGDRIKHLRKSCDGAIVSNGDDTPTTFHCETCARTKMTHIISRRPPIRTRVPTPLGDVSIDIMEFNVAFNGDRYCLHAYDQDTHLNFVWTMASANQDSIVEAIKELFRWIKYMGRTIFSLSGDNDRGYGLLFRSTLLDEGITWKPSAPYTPAQDPAERSGGLLVQVARAIAIQSGLPEGLWPELLSTAAYLLNRAPSQSLGFKTPMEKATGRQPNIAHLYKPGARAYAYKTNPKDLPRKMKLDGRCHLGYLVGFEGHNIYRI